MTLLWIVLASLLYKASIIGEFLAGSTKHGLVYDCVNVMSTIPFFVMLYSVSEMHRMGNKLPAIIRRKFLQLDCINGDQAVQILHGTNVVYYDSLSKNVGFKGLGFFTISYSFVASVACLIWQVLLLSYVVWAISSDTFEGQRVHGALTKMAYISFVTFYINLTYNLWRKSKETVNLINDGDALLNALSIRQRTWLNMDCLVWPVILITAASNAIFTFAMLLEVTVNWEIKLEDKLSWEVIIWVINGIVHSYCSFFYDTFCHVPLSKPGDLVPVKVYIIFFFLFALAVTVEVSWVLMHLFIAYWGVYFKRIVGCFMKKIMRGGLSLREIIKLKWMFLSVVAIYGTTATAYFSIRDVKISGGFRELLNSHVNATMQSFCMVHDYWCTPVDSNSKNMFSFLAYGISFFWLLLGMALESVWLAHLLLLNMFGLYFKKLFTLAVRKINMATTNDGVLLVNKCQKSQFTY
ncbi:unnamed protein product [Orchesella dallaii]